MATIDPTYIPQELTNRPQWIVWRYENGNAKRKVPYDAKNGKRAKSNDANTWTHFEDALTTATNYDGIGYVFAADDPYVGIDLDDCINGEEAEPWALDIINSLKSYSEISPSGKGIKIWVAGDVPSSLKTEHIEIYKQTRYFAVTGWHVKGTPTTIRNANGELHALWDSLKPQKQELPEPTHTTRVAGQKYLERWAQYKIEYAVDRVKQATDGEKHNTRYAMARLLGGLIPHGLTTDDAIARALFDANQPRTEAQRSEYKTILDGIHDGTRVPLPLPPEPEQPIYDATGYACCPKHKRILDAARNGNGWKCRARDSSTESGWCDFWWDGDGYSIPQTVDPDTGEVLDTLDDPDILLNAHRSDAGNAVCFATLYGDELRFCHTRKKWLAWDGSRWTIDEGMARGHYAMIDVVQHRLRAFDAIEDLDQRKKAAMWCIGCESTNKVEASMKAASRHPAIKTTIEDYDTDPLLAAAIGATLDLRTVAHRSIRREDFLTMRLGATYDPTADCPRWRQFLNEIFIEDTEIISYIQRAVGYCLTGDTREQKLFLCHGTGANGKSVFLETLTHLLGDYAANASFETFDANKRSESTNDLAALRGKRLVTVIETEENKRLAEARVKSVTGQDLITCRFLYGEYFSYRPTFKIWLAMNHLPVIRGADKGIWRRIQLIPFKQNFDEHEDKTLRETLQGEMDGVLQWALVGLREWWKRGLDTPQSVTQATNNYRADSDQIGRWINDRCVVVLNVSVSSGQGYKNYTGWCAEVGEEPISQNKWSRRITEKGFQPNPNTSNRGWIGFGLKMHDDS
jgi:putative DNA primase/helicase